MTIKVTNCGDCIFRVEDYNPDSMGYDTIDTCIFLRKESIFNKAVIKAYDSWEEEKPKELEQRLENCPLDKEQIIISL